MMASFHIKSEEGFTIQEILVALTVSSILISLSFSLFLFTNKLFRTWHSKEEIRQQVNRMLHVLTMDVQQSREIVEITDSSLVLSKGIGKPTFYRFNDKTVWRNDVELNSLGSVVMTVKATPHESNSSTSVLKLDVSGKSKFWQYQASSLATILPSSRATFLGNRE